MRIWVDADACPNVIKDILFRVAERLKLPVRLVANRPMKVPPSAYVRAVRVGAGFDAADRYIAEAVAAGDVVVTADIPLAAQVIERGAHALGPRGEYYTRDNIGERLAVRDMLDLLRGSGVMTGGQTALTLADRQSFANRLDRLLSRALKDGQCAS